jgi:hypothetical protein
MYEHNKPLATAQRKSQSNLLDHSWCSPFSRRSLLRFRIIASRRNGDALKGDRTEYVLGIAAVVLALLYNLF